LDIIEAVVGDKPEVTGYIVDISKWAMQTEPDDEDAAIALANKELENFRVRYVKGDPIIASGGGRVESDGTIKIAVDNGFYTLVSNPRFPDVIRHEFVHQEQVRQAGEGADKLAAQSYRNALNPDGSINMDRYYLIPYEIMAYAKSVADDLKKMGLSKDEAFRMLRTKMEFDKLPKEVKQFLYPYYARRKKHKGVWHKFLRYMVEYIKNWPE
jgi:hypothetical protein